MNIREYGLNAKRASLQLHKPLPTKNKQIGIDDFDLVDFDQLEENRKALNFESLRQF